MFATNASIGNVLAYNSITIKESRNLQKNAVPAEVRGRHTRITNLQSQKLQEQASTNSAIVCAVVRVQRVVSGKVSRTGIMSCCVHCSRDCSRYSSSSYGIQTGWHSRPNLYPASYLHESRTVQKLLAHAMHKSRCSDGRTLF